MNFIDTHCHLNDDKFTDDLVEVINHAEEVGVNRIINFGATLNDSLLAVKLANQYENLFAGVGIHPEEIDDFNDDTLIKLTNLTQNDKVIAIGEIGLDYHWSQDSEIKLRQQDIFIRQLDLARQLHLPVCIHSRDAHNDTLKILKSNAKGLQGVLHCFSGSIEMAKEVWKLNFLIGFDGPITFKNSAKLPEIVKAVPEDMFLIETDAPYLAPTPYRGKRNEPAYVIEVAKKIAELRNDSLEHIAQLSTNNAQRLYNLR